MQNEQISLNYNVKLLLVIDKGVYNYFDNNTRRINQFCNEVMEVINLVKLNLLIN